MFQAKSGACTSAKCPNQGAAGIQKMLEIQIDIQKREVEKLREEVEKMGKKIKHAKLVEAELR